MKTIFQKILFLPLLMMIFSGGIAFAQTSASSCPQKDAAGNCLYTELAPLPGTYLPEGCAGNFVGPLQPGQTTPGCQTTLQTYLPGLFNFGIAIAGLMAFVVITFAGLKYVTVETIYGKSDARELLENALWGLLLVIAAWVILNTINPGILNFNLSMQPPPATTSATPSATAGGAPGARAADGTLLPYALTDAQVTQNTTDVNNLKTANVGVNAGPCTSATVDTGCTDIVGLPPAALAGVVNLASVAGCGIGKTSCVTITGGAEGGHLDHGPGQPVVDIAENNTLTSYITAHGGTPVQTKLGPQYTATVYGETVTFLHESNPPHWHAVFK